VDCGLLQGENSRATYLPVIVCSIQTLASRGIPEGVELFIIDEAHFCAASKEFLALVRRHPGVPMIGFSATPFTRGLGKVYEFGALFEGIVKAATIPELIERGFLVDANVYAPSTPDLTGVKIVAGDFNEKQLGVAVDKPDLIGDIVAHWLKLAGGKRTICFATNIAHSKHIVEQFTAAGVRAKHIDAYTPESDRRRIIDGFKAGEFEILSNCSILAEGFDCPAAEVMILARPTRSLVRHVQAAGRVLRPFEGKAVAIILDHSGTTQRLGFVTDELPIELDDGRPRKSGDGQKPEEKLPKKCGNCYFMKPAGVHKCPACGFAPQRQSDVEVGAGELTLLKRKKDLAQRFGTKQDVWSMLLMYRRGRYSEGWCAHKYRAIFGVWPRGLRDEAMLVSDDLNRWIRSEQIRWASARAGKGERHAA
jgi:superfamily II DNA or RNA helicase